MPKNAVLISLLVVLAIALSLNAQQVLGSITGTVADPTGAPVPAAKVSVKNVDTNLEVAVETLANGSYLVPNLPIGNYTVSIAREGFKTEHHPSILVEGARTATVNGKLEVGTVATTVDVVSTPLLNQVDTSTGYMLDEQAIQNTPLGTGSFTQLAILSPGVSADFLNTSGANAGLGNQAIWSNGQRDTSNSFAINGLTNNNLFNGKSTSQVASSRFTANTGAINLAGGDTQTDTSVYASIGNSMSTPAPETLQELHVVTAMYDASEGGKSGAHISVITRSGTNSFHGQAFEHFQNNVLNAASFFRNASTAISAHDKVPKLHYNRFGATLGGPVRKDKIFFFAAYNRIENHDALNGSRTTSVPLHLTDDRSAQALSNVALLDFGKTIAPSQIDPSALKVMQFKLGDSYLIPSAQITDAAAASRLGYDVYLQAPSTFQHYQFIANTDFNISAKDRLSQKVIYQSSPGKSPLSSGASTLGFPQENQSNATTAALDNVVILTPSLTWEQKVGVVRMVSNVQTRQPANPLDLGINIFGSTSFPAIVIATADNNVLRKSFQLGSFAATANAGTFQNQYTGSTHVNWVHGRHIIYSGVNWDSNQLNIANNASNVAEINFSLFSDFLAGAPLANSTFNRYYAGTSNRYYRAQLVGAFVQDNFRVASNFNISLGLRWDYSGPFHEKYGRLVNFHPDQYKYDGATDTIVNSGLVIAGNNATLGNPGVSDSTLTGRQWGFGPRIGLVWSPSNLRNVVFRTGFGMFYDRGEYFTELSPPAGSGFNGPFGVTLAPPFIQQVSPASNASGVIIGNLSQPFAGAVLPAPVTTQSAFANLLPNAAGLLARKTSYLFGGYDPANTLPYTENWTFDVQWQPRNSLSLTLGYVGNRSLHQVLPIPFNQPGIATAANPIHGEIYSYGFNVVPVETAHTFDGGNTDLRTPYLGISNNSVFYKANGVATYNSLQFGVRKRLSKGLQVAGSYTWSHTLDEQSGLGLFFNGNDPLNPRSSYGTSTYDRTHVLTMQYYYRLPNVASEHSIFGKIGNGWALSGITILQSGFPFNEYDFSGAAAGQFYSNNVQIVDPVLPLKPGVTVKQATLQGTTGYDINKPFVDSASFVIPQIAPGTNGVPACAATCDTFETSYGWTGRNTFRAPFQFRADVTALKQTKIGDKLTVRFQFDAFNVFNHPTFDAPATSSAGLYTVSSAGVPTARPFLNTFGVIQRTIGSPRFLQLSMAVVF